MSRLDPALVVEVIETQFPQLARARFMAACRGVADLMFGLETERREYVVGGLHALERLPR